VSSSIGKRSSALPPLISPEFHAGEDIAAKWLSVRQRTPFYWHDREGPGFWVVAKHADARYVLKNSSLFNSLRGNVMDTLLAGGDSASGLMLAVSDGQEHRLIRSYVLKIIENKISGRFSEDLHRTTDEIVQQAVEKDVCDFAKEVASQVPISVVSDLLDVPENDRPTLQKLASAALTSHTADAALAAGKVAQTGIIEYFSDLARSKSATAEGTFLHSLVTLSKEDRKLELSELIFNCYSLLLGGYETARLSMTGSAKALADNPSQWQLLRSGGVALDTAIDELLRWTSPAMHVGRTAAQATELHGQRIHDGDIITVWIASANFDPEEFVSPQLLDLARAPNRHLSFGYGSHFCVGATLARMEFRAFASSLLRYVEDIELVGAPRAVSSNFLRGYKQLYARLHRRRDNFKSLVI